MKEEKREREKAPRKVANYKFNRNIYFTPCAYLTCKFAFQIREFLSNASSLVRNSACRGNIVRGYYGKTSVESASVINILSTFAFCTRKFLMTEWSTRYLYNHTMTNVNNQNGSMLKGIN
ncbi:hypothetical protein PUN28_019333 [Cardiocondyla obscurior]|uniref:Uncharacterized protein n=1 Tax=Cardiocondyla obscurior TaxID=286306 RepID=A0AAW2EB13_9HYME